MAQCKLSAKEFIINSFTPQVAAVCSTHAESTCQKNNLSFIELLQPFCRLNTEGQFKDPQGTVITIKSLQINMKDMNYSPPEPSLARKLLNDSVTSYYNDHMNTIHVNNIDLDIPVSVPWFEAWRETFLNVQFPSDHEFIKHFLACMIVISTQELNPLEKIQQIGAQLNLNIAGKLPKWFNNNVLRYYILLHDAIEDDLQKAEDIFGEMKNIYGANNCYFLKMNSRPHNNSIDNNLPDPWSQFIVKLADSSPMNELGSLPHTPTEDTTGVSSMPNSVITDQEKSSSQASTPLMSQSFPIIDKTENISGTAEISSVQVNLEIAQEAVQVITPTTVTTIHPLSPDNNLIPKFEDMDITEKYFKNSALESNAWTEPIQHVNIQHGIRLSTDDLERLKLMVYEFYLKSLLPYVEKQIGILNDLISNKKGVSRSIFSATKRWFGTTKPGIPGALPNNMVVYTTESPELQLRRLGDLCFMFGHYTLAYQAYHNAKRDFAADQAWLYYAGALEMAALSAFMMDEMIRKTVEYMDDAIMTYLNTCKMPQFATRATLLSAECLKNRALYGEAAKQLIRMTSEDSDLRSALLLEQAAYCFVPSKMIRKYAFHTVLAGHRFSKAGQKKHSLRCYQQSYQVFNNKGWALAEDHIHFTIGRQAISLKRTNEALYVFEKLLNESSKQPAFQQAVFLREYLFIHNIVNEKSGTQNPLPILPLPSIHDNNIKVLLGPHIQHGNQFEMANQILTLAQDSDNTRWFKLEEILLTKVQGSPPMIFKPTIILHGDSTQNFSRLSSVIDEPIYVCIDLINPLLIPILISNLKLLWKFEVKDTVFINEIHFQGEEKIISTSNIDSIVIQPASTEIIVLTVIPHKMGKLQILGISYDLSNQIQNSNESISTNSTYKVTGKRLFNIKGARLKNVKEKEGVPLYGTDMRLHFDIIHESPFLEVSFSNVPSDLLCGELQSVEMTIKNIGNASLRNIHFGFTNPSLFVFSNEPDFKQKNVGKKPNEFIIKAFDCADKNETLVVGDMCKINLWIQAPHKKGNHCLDLLIYYENSMTNSVLKYRLHKHSWYLNVLDSIQIKVMAQRVGEHMKNFSVLNLILDIKNMNQVHDPFMNEIEIQKVSLLSKFWMIENMTNILDTRILPLEVLHSVLKLSKKLNDIEELTATKSSSINDLTEDIPYARFIKKRHLKPLCEIEFQQNLILKNNDHIAYSTMKVDSFLILRWRSNILDRGNTRTARGQHIIDIHYLNNLHIHPYEKVIESLEYSAKLKIFGPEMNIPESQVPSVRSPYSADECLQNIVWFHLKYPKIVDHNFWHERVCIIPVVINVHSNIESNIDVRIDTIGTSSQTHLPNIRSQLYSPQASINFHYAGHSAITFSLEPHMKQEVKLQAIVSISGTYDLSSRLEVFARVENKLDYILQKWNMESVCIINDTRVP